MLVLIRFALPVYDTYTNRWEIRRLKVKAFKIEILNYL